MGGFDDLENLEDADQQQDAEDEPESEPTPQPPSTDETDSATTTTDTTMTETTTQTPDDESTDDWKRTPAFPYDDASQEAIYPRKSVWSELENALQYDVERELVAERGHENIQKRELHDAMARVLLSHLEEIPNAVEDARRDG